MSDDFWGDMQGAFSVILANDEGGFRNSHEMEGSVFTGVRALTDKFREANALPLPVDAGTRVKFVANLGSVLTYDDIPDPRVEGTVVTVRTASGHTTAMDESVFVLWDDGKFRPIMAEHLRLAGVKSKRAMSMRIVAGDFGDLSAFFAPTARQDELVHKATKDLWAVRQDQGQYVIERLFNDNGQPLKV